MRRIARAKYCYVLICTTFLFCFANALAGEDIRPVDVPLCSLNKNPEHFNKKRVRIRGTVRTAVIEGGTWLYDDSCAKNAIELEIPEAIRKNLDDHPDFKALDDAILHQGNIGTVGKKITATFTGVFTWRAHGRPRRVLTADKVENMDVKLEK